MQNLLEVTLIFTLIILCLGKPDLLDAIVSRVQAKSDCYQTIFHIEEVKK